MPVIAMTVTSKTAHEKTDQLFIYTFERPDAEPIQVVANLTNVYDVGNVVAVAQVGTFLEEGEIVPRKVFGIPSAGMALGPVDATPGDDLTQQFDADPPVQTFRATFTIEVEGRFATDVEKAARKLFKSGQGQLIDCTPAR